MNAPPDVISYDGDSDLRDLPVSRAIFQIM
jgi:hypothetical protein